MMTTVIVLRGDFSENPRVYNNFGENAKLSFSQKSIPHFKDLTALNDRIMS